MTTYKTLTFTTAIPVLQRYITADQPILLLGNPGIGKSALAGDIAKLVELALEVVISSTCDPTDIGGFPVVRSHDDDKHSFFSRIPMRAIRRAAERPTLLLLDELTTPPPAVQATLLQGIYARQFGDVRLHPDSRIMAAANPVEQAPGGYELSAPLVGRFGIYWFEPTMKEFQEYLERLGDEGSDLRMVAADLSGTLEAKPDLLQMTPPKASITDAAKWASPRDWERALRVWSAGDPDIDDNTLHALLAGSVGEHAAAGFVGIRKLRVHLPTVSDIKADPNRARLPSETAYQIGSLGLLAQVAQEDSWPAWAYTVRLSSPEIRAAAGRMLLRRPLPDSSKWQSDGRKARTKILSEVGADLAA